jgi:hypothetical protein
VCAEHAALSRPGDLAVSDAKPAPGQGITITGSGYRNGESVTFSIGDTAIGSAVADSSGTATLSGTVPAGVAGTTVAVSGVGAGSGHTDTATLTVKKSAHGQS